MSVFTIGKVKKYLSVSWINFGRTEKGEWDKRGSGWCFLCLRLTISLLVMLPGDNLAVKPYCIPEN